MPSWRQWGPWMKAKVKGGSLLLTTVLLCFFQVENSNSWFRGVRTCARLWTSSPTEPGCKLYAVGTNLFATSSRSLCPCFLPWLRQQKFSIIVQGSIYISFLFQPITNHFCLCLSVRMFKYLPFPLLSMPRYPFFSVICLPLPHISTLFSFSINSAWSRIQPGDALLFPSASCRVGLSLLPLHTLKWMCSKSLHIHQSGGVLQGRHKEKRRVAWTILWDLLWPHLCVHLMRNPTHFY